ncbi:MAG TPA: fructose-6-phosphate aldolase [Dehalococcoidia bacterium]|jgi:transaldolase|nr:fructose-6-phosphate aldolase [Dehalococcoidia bacterium]
MRIFLDTANIEHIRQAAKLGIIDGVTTNPSLVSREGRADYKAVVQEICSIIPGPVSVEVLGQETAQMIAEAREYSTWATNVIIKIPVSAAGLEAIATLSQEGIKINLTLCFSLNQALLGARAGARYVSPFVGRLDDIGHDGMELVKDIVDTFKRYELPTEVIAASIRHPLHCVVAAKAGAHIATVPYNVLMQMIEHPLTTAGVARFLQDWQRLAAR